jgi:hypothetical protein
VTTFLEIATPCVLVLPLFILAAAELMFHAPEPEEEQ